MSTWAMCKRVWQGAIYLDKIDFPFHLTGFLEFGEDIYTVASHTRTPLRFLMLDKASVVAPGHIFNDGHH